MDLETLLERINLGEDQDIEFKSADGGFPNLDSVHNESSSVHNESSSVHNDENLFLL